MPTSSFFNPRLLMTLTIPLMAEEYGERFPGDFGCRGC